MQQVVIVLIKQRYVTVYWVSVGTAPHKHSQMDARRFYGQLQAKSVLPP